MTLFITHPPREGGGPRAARGRGDRRRDRGQNVVTSILGQNIHSNDPQDMNAVLRRPLHSPIVVLDLLWIVVNASLDFDFEPTLCSGKIEDVWADRMFSPESQSSQAVSTQRLPQQHFGKGHLAAERSRALNGRDRRPHLARIMQPYKHWHGFSARFAAVFSLSPVLARTLSLRREAGLWDGKV